MSKSDPLPVEILRPITGSPDAQGRRTFPRTSPVRPVDIRIDGPICVDPARLPELKPDWPNGQGGYLKNCRDCGRKIFLGKNSRGKWMPWASWAFGDAANGEWKPHNCAF